MKYSIFILIALASIVACSHSVRIPIHSDYSDERDPVFDSIDAFYTGYFAHFNLPKPTEIIKCFHDKKEVIRFWISLYDMDKLLIAIKDRDNCEVHMRYIEQVILAQHQKEVSKCIIRTQDYADLLDALGIKWSELKKYAIGQYLYFQANYTSLIEDYRPIIQTIDSHDYGTTGEVTAALAQKLVNIVKEEKFAFHAIIGLSNGVAMGVGVDDPQDSIDAWNETTGKSAMKFLYGLAEAVADGSPKDALRNTVKFWKEKGAELLKQIPESVWDQLHDSDDNKKLTEKLGVDFFSKEFAALTHRFVKRHPFAYYVHLKIIKHSLDEYGLLHSGSTLGKFFKAIARGKSEEVVEQAQQVEKMDQDEYIEQVRQAEKVQFLIA